MSARVKAKRPYHAPRRIAAAALTREAILQAAKHHFESYGWAGTTIAAVAAEAEVSPKTIESLFATKAALLTTVVDYAIRGDTHEVPMAQRDAGQAVENAPDAATMLERHIEHAIPITQRSAAIAHVVESAAASNLPISELWERMTRNRRFGARWAAEALLSKPGIRADLTAEEAERIFLIAIDWATYRTLATELNLTTLEVEDWMRRLYRRMFLS
jgi:AcrR family transcriptional regulator